MIIENRKYQYIGQLSIIRSKSIDIDNQPKDDEVNWLFLKIQEKRFSFIYKIVEPIKAEYEKPFLIYMDFMMYETIKDAIRLRNKYEILRGEESIGTVILIEVIDI